MFVGLLILMGFSLAAGWQHWPFTTASQETATLVAQFPVDRCHSLDSWLDLTVNVYNLKDPTDVKVHVEPDPKHPYFKPASSFLTESRTLTKNATQVTEEDFGFQCDKILCPSPKANSSSNCTTLEHTQFTSAVRLWVADPATSQLTFANIPDYLSFKLVRGRTVIAQQNVPLPVRLYCGFLESKEAVEVVSFGVAGSGISEYQKAVLSALSEEVYQDVALRMGVTVREASTVTSYKDVRLRLVDIPGFSKDTVNATMELVAGLVRGDAAPRSEVPDMQGLGSANIFFDESLLEHATKSRGEQKIVLCFAKVSQLYDISWRNAIKKIWTRFRGLGHSVHLVATGFEEVIDIEDTGEVDRLMRRLADLYVDPDGFGIPQQIHFFSGYKMQQHKSTSIEKNAMLILHSAVSTLNKHRERMAPSRGLVAALEQEVSELRLKLQSATDTILEVHSHALQLSALMDETVEERPDIFWATSKLSNSAIMVLFIYIVFSLMGFICIAFICMSILFILFSFD